MTTKNLSEKIDQLSQKLIQLKAQKQQADALLKSRNAAAERKNDTRRKILLGSFLIDQLGFDGAARLSIQGRQFGAWLTRQDDLILFGLHPSITSTATPPASGGDV